MTGEERSIDPVYVAARSVLLDALEALDAHRQALILVGAQAVYLRTGTAGLIVAPYTTDGDVAIDPSLLGDDPALQVAMRRRGFELLIRADGGIEPGTWIGKTQVGTQRHSVPVDLLVPAAVLTGGTTRGARLPVHGKSAAKRTPGIEAALVDHDEMTITGLAPGDDRQSIMAVAGVAALFVAKVIKLRDRIGAGRPHRLIDKDAGDVLRLVRATPVATMAGRLGALGDHPIAGPATRAATEALTVLFRSPESPGVIMAVRYVEGDLPAVQVEVQLTSYIRELRRRLDV